jgi:hypothetical protein
MLLSNCLDKLLFHTLLPLFQIFVKCFWNSRYNLTLFSIYKCFSANIHKLLFHTLYTGGVDRLEKPTHVSKFDAPEYRVSKFGQI